MVDLLIVRNIVNQHMIIIYYLGEIQWIQYDTTGTDIIASIIALSNEVRKKAIPRIEVVFL